ncbi:outer membrane assembly lipoprotein YfgL [Escherichia coli]|nr:outer membrane assembly lipoprotein YfgL [Escherichia coli]
MQLRKLLLPGLLSVTLLSGCSLFNSEEDVVKMSPLPTVENQFYADHGVEHFRW